MYKNEPFFTTITWQCYQYLATIWCKWFVAQFLAISQQLLCIHTNYPHPHATVSTILLLFLSLLLHGVFCQHSPNDICTTGGPNFSGISRVSRISCTAQSCLSCSQAKAECLHNATSNTFTCTANTSECEVVICEPVASTVYEYLQVQPQVKISLFIHFSSKVFSKHLLWTSWVV